MRAYILLTVLLSVACAKPQYGYQQPVLSQSGLLSQQIGQQGGLLSQLIGQQGGLLSQQIGQQGGLLSQQIGQQQGGNKYLPPATTTQAPLVHKQFFLISAPEENQNEIKRKHLVLGRAQKNYRVVFIKAPVPESTNVKYSAEFAPNEEKTVIYILSKKGEDILSEEISTPAPTQPSKPEVFFIKYKTDEEANNAQREIQGQYDKLGGTEEFDQGTAPITSVIGSLDGLNPDGSYNYKQISSSGSSSLNAESILAPNTQYLPSSFSI